MTMIRLFLCLSLLPCLQAQPGFRGPSRSPLLPILDTDGNGKLEAEEIAQARASLLARDRNGDGNLEASELQPPRQGRRGRRGPGGPGGGSFRDPLMEAVDLDRDGELFEDEVENAAANLGKLDKNGDGRLTRSEHRIRPKLRSGGGRPRGGPPGGGPGRGGGEGGALKLPTDLGPEDAMATMPDFATFEKLSYQGEEVMVDAHLAGLQFIKFQVERADTEAPLLYFMNTKTHRSHPGFMRHINARQNRGSQMRGVLVYWPRLKAPNGKAGLFTFEFNPGDDYSLEKIRWIRDLMEQQGPCLKGRMAYKMMSAAQRRYAAEKQLWDESDVPIFDEKRRFRDLAFLPLHKAKSVGRLRLMRDNSLPGPRDIVIYPTLPNEMPRVAGVITGVPQTPLSHVNLRAVQDDVPNAFILAVEQNREIMDLVGKLVHFEVGDQGYKIRPASSEEFEAHFAHLRPKQGQTPPRDLQLREIRPLAELGFADADKVGVKAANLATLGKLGLPEGMTPEGFAVPFSCYVAFMEHNGYFELAKKLCAEPRFQKDPALRAKGLQNFQELIKRGRMPQWIVEALSAVQARFAKGVSIRCRSSTNNEDLPGFSGAGLYDSFTHHTGEGHLQKSIKQVYASLWNFRAFEEREFYRIDHMATAMGVVLHVNSSDEAANGVAVTRDILYQSEEDLGIRYYVNIQKGEILVTNPDGRSLPEEILMSPRNPKKDLVLRRSSLAASGAALLSDAQLLGLRRALRRVEAGFRELYKPAEGDPFAMEVEFKVLASGELFIKQARPWVF